MDLMTLAAKITLDDSGFQSGINNAVSMGEGLAGKLSSLTIAGGQLIADFVKKSISEIQNVIGGAVDGYADYQQLIGGVETLFKGSADKVSNYAKQSFRTTGLSANDYMETVTSFSASLLQGLNGDTEQAAELANKAITDMADNANKMGTDLSSIQTAYQGFAKQNYTMLDNLKLGYGGTKDEMIRLVNDSGILQTKIDSLDGITFDQLIEAIHKIQEEMGITGTTASEAAGTISGSKASLAAAWQDLLTAVSGDGTDESVSLDTSLENFKTSFKTYMDNYIPTLNTTVENLGTLVNGVADAVAKLPKNMLSNLFSAGLGAGAEMMQGAGEIVTWLIDSITQALTDAKINPEKVAAFGESLGNFVGTSVGSILTNLPAITDGLFSVGVTMAGSIIEGIWEGLFGSESGNELEKIQQEFNSTVSEAELSSIRAQSILEYMSDLEEKYGAAVRETTEWQKAEDELEKVLGGSKKVFEDYGSNIGGAIEKLKEMTKELRNQAIIKAAGDRVAAAAAVVADLELQKEDEQFKIDIANEIKKNTGRDATLKAYAQILGNKDNEMWLNDATRYLVNTASSSPETLRADEIESLIGMIEELYRINNTSETDKVWNEDLTDNILDPNSLREVNKQYEEQVTVVDGSTEKIKELDAALVPANKELETSQALYARVNVSLESLAISSDNAAAHIAKLSLVSPKVLPRTGTTGRESVPVIAYTPEATGIEDVPYTGFRAELHKGEAILTKEENDARKRGSFSGAAEMEQALEDAIERSMSRMYLNLNGNKVADFTARRTGQVISANEHSRVRSMGG